MKTWQRAVHGTLMMTAALNVVQDFMVVTPALAQQSVNITGGLNSNGQASNSSSAPVTLSTQQMSSTGAVPPIDAIYLGGLGQSTEPTKATTGNLTGWWFDLAGKAVVSPFAPRELNVSGNGSATSTTFVTIIAAGGASVKTYITSVQCGRSDSGTAAITVTFNDANSALLVVPNNGGGGGNNAVFNSPLVTAANTTFQFKVSTPISTVFCNAQGFSGY